MTETVQKEICVRVNGEERCIPAGLSISDMVEAIGLNPGKVAVERNLEVVPRSSLREVEARDGDSFEIVHFVGGG